MYREQGTSGFPELDNDLKKAREEKEIGVAKFIFKTQPKPIGFF